MGLSVQEWGYSGKLKEFDFIIGRKFVFLLIVLDFCVNLVYLISLHVNQVYTQFFYHRPH